MHFMRRSALKHPISLLREHLGLTQKDIAKLLGKSVSIVQKIELTKKPVSREIAEQLAIKTGVSLEWILKGDPTDPIRDFLGFPYSRKDFEQRYDPYTLETRPVEADRFRCIYFLLTRIGELVRITLSATERKQIESFMATASVAVSDWKREFGLSSALDEEFKSNAIREALRGDDLFEPVPPVRRHGQRKMAEARTSGLRSLLNRTEEAFAKALPLGAAGNNKAKRTLITRSGRRKQLDLE